MSSERYVDIAEFSDSLPVFRAKARIVYGDDLKSKIECEESACTFFDDGGCTNEQAMIEDDCPTDQWCASYSPRN